MKCNITEISIFYQDVKNGASFVIQRDLQGKQNMFGTFSFGGEEYSMQTSSQKNFSSFHGRLENVHLIKERKRNVNFDDIYKIGDSFKSQTYYHRRKRATGSQKIELLIFCDYAIYSYWYAKSKKSTIQEKETDALTTIRQYYAFVLNGMDAMYKNIQTSAYTISILFTGIIISQTPGDAPWTETIKNTAFTPNRVDSTVGLSNFQTWVKQQTSLPDHDHAMLFTRYDLTASGFTGNAGLAFTSAVCTENSQSIVEERFDFVVITTAAHELGHCLSANHDGTGNLCSPSDAYIMAPSSMPQQGANAAHPWIFSSCSTQYFTSYIDQLDLANNNCMKTLSPSFDPTAQSPYDQFLAGQVYNADSQCVQLHGDGSYLCREQYNSDFSTICNILWCYKPDDAQCHSAVAGRGTLCGNQKWCVSGVCTQDVKAPKGNENCLYGDRKGILFSNLGWTCADAYANDPGLCTSQPAVSQFCCGSCFPETTTLPISTQHYVTSTEHLTTEGSDTTTPVKTTHIEPETTSETITTIETSTESKTTTPAIHTTMADTTTPQVITTNPSTTLNVATTPKSSTQQAVTTTVSARTTKTESITTESATTTTELTTTPEETSIITTKHVKPTTTVQTTTAQKDVTTKAVTSTTESTPTEQVTLVSTFTTQQPETSTVNVTNVVDNIFDIIANNRLN
ncbi:A disintegrin and metalloproteinase with thrombospondin motifs 16-like [Mytilus trossulus]|uniref:A disintegrin and metalloproteinase with thrombospondin motifs 16-like n=1 Tax=Mytilus trossulus TaxID=6551 RepID=UPI003005CDED